MSIAVNGFLNNMIIEAASAGIANARSVYYKIIDLNTKVSTEKTMVTFVFEIDGGNIYIAMSLIN